MQQLSLIIHGRVQGVFFRKFIQNHARELDLVGWVKNMPDGTVMVCAEGEEEKLRLLQKKCLRGPFMAHVEKVEETWKNIDAVSFERFSIQ